MKGHRASRCLLLSGCCNPGACGEKLEGIDRCTALIKCCTISETEESSKSIVVLAMPAHISTYLCGYTQV